MQCFTAFRTLGASVHHHVKHAAHRLGAHHVHRVHHVLAHSIIGPAPIPAVCFAAGLAALGIGGLVAEGMGVAPSASKAPTTAAGNLAPNLPSGIGSPLGSRSSSSPAEIGRLPVYASSLDWNELASPPVPPSSFDWKDVEGLPSSPESFDTSGPDSVQVPPGQPAAVLEPSSISALAAGLLMLAILLQRKKPVCGRIVYGRSRGRSVKTEIM
jgi:hypothetical protein